MTKYNSCLSQFCQLAYKLKIYYTNLNMSRPNPAIIRRLSSRNTQLQKFAFKLKIVETTAILNLEHFITENLVVT